MTTKSNSVAKHILSIVEPIVDGPRDPNDTSPENENQNRAFHVAFDRFVGSAHRAVQSAKDYADRMTAQMVELTGSDPELNDIRTLLACERAEQAETQHSVAIELRAAFDEVYESVTGETFDVDAWQAQFAERNEKAGAMADRRAHFKKKLAKAS